MRRLQELAQISGAAEAPAGVLAGTLQGPAVDWLARVVPGAGQHDMLALSGSCIEADEGVARAWHNNL